MYTLSSDGRNTPLKNTSPRDVAIFKSKWLEAFMTSREVQMSFPNGRVINVSTKVSPEAVGFPPDQANDILKFQTMVVKRRTCKVFHDMIWKYCDEYLLSMAESFVMEGVIKDFTLMSQPVSDVRLSQLTPAVLVRFIFDEDAYTAYMDDIERKVNEQTIIPGNPDADIVIIGDENATDTD